MPSRTTARTCYSSVRRAPTSIWVVSLATPGWLGCETRRVGGRGACTMQEWEPSRKRKVRGTRRPGDKVCRHKGRAVLTQRLSKKPLCPRPATLLGPVDQAGAEPHLQGSAAVM